MIEIVDVNTGDIVLGEGNVILRSVALGSCIVVVAYDSKKKIGAIAHIMLPDKAPENILEKTRYAADAIDEMIGRMLKKGSKHSNIEVCLVGGSNVLKRKDDTICEANIESVTQVLRKKKISVKSKVLGGTERKSVFLDVENGKIFYVEGECGERLLWEAVRRSEK